MQQVELTDRLDSLFRQLVNAHLQGAEPVLNGLREQFPKATIGKVEYSGVGFFVQFNVPADVRSVKPSDFEIIDVAFKLKDMNTYNSAILFIRNGKLDFLELVALDGMMPIDPVLVSWHNIRDPKW